MNRFTQRACFERAMSSYSPWYVVNGVICDSTNQRYAITINHKIVGSPRDLGFQFECIKYELDDIKSPVALQFQLALRKIDGSREGLERIGSPFYLEADIAFEKLPKTATALIGEYYKSALTAPNMQDIHPDSNFVGRYIKGWKS